VAPPCFPSSGTAPCFPVCYTPLVRPHRPDDKDAAGAPARGPVTGRVPAIPEEPVYLGFGSNLGDGPAAFNRALGEIGRLPGTLVTSRSSLYRTAPVGYNDQPEFLNGAAGVKTPLAPRAFLDALKEIERRLGRRAGGPRWGPREIDLDILLWGERVIEEPGLVVPHPEMHRRGFVLIPLAEIAPGAIHPVLGRPVGELAASLEHRNGVERIGDWQG
jgi:2-amino-4-hydroxy-6-hydroxymethyldihydropteridine diphosphokinase